MKEKKSRVRKKLIIALTTVTVVMASFAHDKFTDVPTKHWAHDTISWGVEQNIVDGYGDNTFKPNQDVTEAEFLKMFISAVLENQDPVQDGDWSSGYYKLAKEKNWSIKGYGNKSIANKKINRTRVAEIISGAAGVNYLGDDAIRYLLTNKYAEGKEDKVTVSGFHGNDFLTRAETVQFIKNAVDKGLNELKDRPSTPSDPNDIPKLPDEVDAGNIVIVERSKDDVKNPIMKKYIEFMPQDKVSEPAIRKFISSIVIKNGLATVTIPDNIPAGYIAYLVGTDNTTVMRQVNGGETKSFKMPESFEFTLYVKNNAKQNIIVMADGNVYWGAKH
ncbi:S-layer homology domain-containing protein [Paenibacillus sp. Leaf72]|uniref:S-layer homology domain-containing protein n=1 Tax=Paenibacillus sp. Leaf72 TaxID=1736234 RepID=UPI0006FE0479|nr:S-layer homology domain-containing protein [Paenibacillus sp. Leaf72]KQN97029.1 hypothetical protein ASF12_23455 [Paenibacillus sp. Leaf72]